MGFSIDLKVTKSSWLSDPTIRWNLGLQRAGLNFRQGLQRSRYPDAPEHTRYIRTYTTADKAGFNITEPGRTMEFGSVDYLQFLLAPSPTTPNWGGKKDELVQLMVDGFKSGIAEFSGGE